LKFRAEQKKIEEEALEQERLEEERKKKAEEEKEKKARLAQVADNFQVLDPTLKWGCAGSVG
jgi:hypothetical protein